MECKVSKEQWGSINIICEEILTHPPNVDLVCTHSLYTAPQGVGDILRDEDTTYGDGDEEGGMNVMLDEQAAEDAMDMAIEHYDARVLNKTAGVDMCVGGMFLYTDWIRPSLIAIRVLSSESSISRPRL